MTLYLKGYQKKFNFHKLNLRLFNFDLLYFLITLEVQGHTEVKSKIWRMILTAIRGDDSKIFELKWLKSMIFPSPCLNYLFRLVIFDYFTTIFINWHSKNITIFFHIPFTKMHSSLGNFNFIFKNVKIIHVQNFDFL